MADRRPRSILFVITTLGVGGAETQLTRIAAALSEGGDTVVVVALRDPPHSENRIDTGSIVTATLETGGSGVGPRTLAKLSRVIRAHSPDVVVTFLLQANVLGRLAAAWHRVPTVSSIRSSRFGGSSRARAVVADWLERLTHPLAAYVVVNSARVADSLTDRQVAPRRRTVVIANAVAGETVAIGGSDRIRERTALGCAPSNFVWLTAGSLEPQKNHAALVRAFTEVHRRHPDARLLIAGEGSLESSLRALTQDLAVTGAVSFLGLRRDLPRVMRLADAFVLASRWEGMPNVVLEALAAGLPTVATPVGGVPELVTPGVTGWLATSPEPRDLSSAMLALMRHPHEERLAIASTARARVVERHGVEPIVEAWSDVIDRAIASRGRR
jgi:glycosyltransferase involved in cell wall biosynthesis